MCVLRLSSTLLCYNCSLSLLAVMTIERHTAITAPFWHNEHVTEHRVIACVVCVIAGEVLGNVVLLAVLLDYDTSEPRLLKRCQATLNLPHWYSHSGYQMKIALEASVIFLLSLRVYLVALKKMCQGPVIFVRKSLRVDPISAEENTFKRNNIMMLITITGIEFLLWIPILFTPIVWEKQSHDFGEVYRSLSRHWLFMIAYKNPLVYALRKPLFRKAYRFLVTSSPRQWKKLNSFLNETSSVFLNTNFIAKLRLEHTWKRMSAELKKISDEHKAHGPYYLPGKVELEMLQGKQLVKDNSVLDIELNKDTRSSKSKGVSLYHLSFSLVNKTINSESLSD